MLNKKTTLFFHLLFFVIFVAAFWLPGFYYYMISLFNVVFIVYSYLIGRLIKRNRNLLYFILPLIFMNGIFFYSSTLVNIFFVLSFLSVGLFLSYHYFRGTGKYFLRDGNIVNDNFLAWTDALGLLSVFLASAFIYGLNYFLNISNWLLLLVIVIISFLVFWQNIFVVSKDYNKSIFFSLLFSLSITPIVGVLFFFPFSPNILAILLLIVYYFSLSFMRFYLSNSLTKKKIKYNLIFIIALFIVLFLSIKWR